MWKETLTGYGSTTLRGPGSLSVVVSGGSSMAQHTAICEAVRAIDVELLTATISLRKGDELQICEENLND